MAKSEEGKIRQIGERATVLSVAAIPDLDPLFQASNRLIEGWMAVGSEMVEFSRTRIDRSLEMGRAIAKSTSLNEAIDAQATFTRSTVQDYLSEVSKLADLGTRSLLETLSTLRQPIREASQRAEAAE
jgi:hypothetical protein